MIDRAPVSQARGKLERHYDSGKYRGIYNGEKGSFRHQVWMVGLEVVGDK